VTAALQGLQGMFSPAPGEPGWAAASRAVALERLGALGLPTVKHQDWRFTSLAPLAALPLRRPGPDDDARAEALLARLPAAEGPRLVLVNGRVRPELSRLGGLPRGSRLLPLSAALAEAEAEVRPHLGRLLPEGSAFAAAGAALAAEGAVLLLGPGAEADGPVQVLHVTAGEATAAFPRLLVVAGAGARASLVQHFLGEGAYLVAPLVEVVLGQGAALELVSLQDDAPQAFHVGSLLVEQGAGSRLESAAFSVGGRLARAEAHVRLAGEEAEATLVGLTMADGARVADTFAVVEHAVPRCTSQESFKAILDGSARGVFAGRVRVLAGAQGTRAHQSSSNLLLSDDAVADTTPQLEILADDVKCGHGGTVGQLDPAALFYLRSRGLPEAAARALLIQAFAAEVVERVRQPALRERVRRLVASRLPDDVPVLEAA
jgi:Fe-S cluster assembly protein SufD